jgi:hypothetical protein
MRQVILGTGRAAVLLLLASTFSSRTLQGQEYRTPRAGEAYSATVFGSLVKAAARDRRSVTAANLTLYAIPSGPQKRRLMPTGGLSLWRNPTSGKDRFRGVLVGLYDEVRWNTSPAFLRGAETALTFENETLPFARSEYVEGARIAAEELKWYTVRLGAGIGYRATIRPGHQDNAFEIALTYEPGRLFFQRGSETAPTFILPRDIYEGRIHLRVRADALERNILELPHEGFAAGLDAYSGHRARWEDWGGPVFGLQNGSEGKSWTAVSLYAVAAGPLPFSRADRHRLIASAYGGTGSRLDRFSAFRLGGGSNAGDFETLTQPILPAAAFEEFFPRHYAIFNLEYRYEALFFLYLQLRGSLAWVERPRLAQNGAVVKRTQPMHSLGAGLTSGFLWNSELELGYAYNFGILRQRDGLARSGGSAILLSFTKEF